MQYFINSKDGSLQAVQNCGDKKPFFTFMSTAEFHKCKEQLPYYKELLHCLGSIRYCKAEVFKNCIIGTLRLPQKSEQRSPQLSFSFYLTGQSLLFVEDVGNEIICRKTDKYVSGTEQSGSASFAVYGANDRG